jgi:acyl-CoA dehydrogenase
MASRRRRTDAVAAFAPIEPDAGSDTAVLALSTERDTDGWRSTGDKTWISNTPQVDFYTVFARTTAGAGTGCRRVRRPGRSHRPFW